MTNSIQAVRGMNDILPADTPDWQGLEEAIHRILAAYGYRELRVPVVEKTELFKRSIGEVTDIVEKEMYTFTDRNGDSLTLRPEGTAGCVRAGIQHGLFYNQVQRLWYRGSMFRHERPQKGRYRQFHQVGAEAFGLEGPDIDAEMILMTARFWNELGIADQVRLELNSLGSAEARARYREQLVRYLNEHETRLDEDSRRRLATNPLRVLDSKAPETQAVLNQAPRLTDHLDTGSREHFATLCGILDAAGIEYRVNPRLVRGLDYYGKTVFEWVTDSLGAQGTVCAGGRYDGLVAHLGGKPTPAVGFAMGLERLVALLDSLDRRVAAPHVPHAYVAMSGARAERHALLLAERLRDLVPGVRIVSHCGGGGFKAQLKRADKSGAALALIVGEAELDQGVVAVKYLREDRPQEKLDEDSVGELLLKVVLQEEQVDQTGTEP